jgi:hypothetical protein
MFKVKVTGLAGLKAEFASMAKELPDIVSGELETMSQEWVKLAKTDAPADQGALRGSITYYPAGPMKYEIVAQKFYAPFMEFGTKGKYTPIPGTEAIAAEFKGYKGGDFMELLRMIVRWVKRKGITGTYSVKTRKRSGNKINQFAEDYSAAWPIAMSILKNGVNPHPFFFKQMHIVWPKMVRNVESRIAQVSKVKVELPSNVTRPQIVTI